MATKKNGTSAKISAHPRFRIDKITVARDNGLLYEPFGIANLDDRDLAISIRDNGIQEPLVLSADHTLLSGHRRLGAAKYLGLKTVPVRIIDTDYRLLGEGEKLALLRQFNQQRDKTPAERIKEKMLEVNPQEAHSKMQRERITNHLMLGKPKSNVQMGAVKKRSRITTIQFLEAVKKVIADNQAYLPMTDRRVHYLLLNNPPLRHDKKPGSRYVNDKGSYKALTNLLLRARLTGDISFDAIEDSTRPIQLGGGFSTAENFIKQETQRFLTGYTRNLMQGQPHHIEIMLEKNALRTVIESVARDYCIPVTTGRGFSSLSPRHDLYVRFRQSGKSKLVLLMLTDFDPDGDEIAASFARSLRDDFGLRNIHPIKVCLTAEDVRDNDLPSDMDAKVTSSNYRKFIDRYGSTKVVELDAAPVAMLQGSLRKAIQGVIDINLFNAQLEQEKQDCAVIEAQRLVAIEAIKGGI